MDLGLWEARWFWRAEDGKGMCNVKTPDLQNLNPKLSAIFNKLDLRTDQLRPPKSHSEAALAPMQHRIGVISR